MKPVSLECPVSNCLLLAQVDSSFFRSRRGFEMTKGLGNSFRAEPSIEAECPGKLEPLLLTCVFGTEQQMCSK